MAYLILSMLMSTAIAVILKFTSMRSSNKYAVTTLNYLAATITMLILTIVGGAFRIPFPEGEPSFFAECSRVIIGAEGLFGVKASFIWAILTGIVTGGLYFGAFICYQKCIDESGAAIAAAFGKIGVVFPLVLSLLIWRDFPGPWQWVGIALAILSIIVMYFDFHQNFFKTLNYGVVVYMLFAGVGQFLNKIFQQYAMIQYKDFYLFVTFFSALLMSLVYFIKTEGFRDKWGMMMGFLAGIPNCLCSLFLVLSLTTVNAAIAYPLFSAGTVAIVSIVSLFLFKEKFGKKEILALLFIFLASIFINIT